jgi:hypothetical protein
MRKHSGSHRAAGRGRTPQQQASVRGKTPAQQAGVRGKTPLVLPPPVFTRRDGALAALLGLAALVVYVATLNPTLAGGDSGELTASAYAGGAAHPPGFPLYSLLARLFCFIPIGSVAWRVNLLSAVANAAAVSVLFAVIRLHTGSLLGAALGAGAFAFSAVVWRYALVAEVFALNNLFVALLLLLLVIYTRDRGRSSWGPPEGPQTPPRSGSDEQSSPAPTRPVYLAVFTAALGLSNHHILLFVALPICGALVWDARKLVAPLRLVALFAAGLAPYLYLPIAARLDPAATWGDPGTLAGFWRHITRQDFGTFRLDAHHGATRFGPGLVAYLGHVGEQTLYLGALVAGWGVLRPLQRLRERFLPAVMLAAFLCYVLVFHAMANLPVDDPFFRRVLARFWQQADVFLFAWLGMGFAALVQRSARRWLPLLVAVVPACVVLQLGRHLGAENQRHNVAFHQFAHAVMRELPPNALLISQGDLYRNAVSYLQTCEGVRRDVTLLDPSFFGSGWYAPWLRRHHPGVVLPPGRFAVSLPARNPAAPPSPGDQRYDLQDLIDANVAAGVPVFMADVDGDAWSRDHGHAERWRETYLLRPQGLTYRLDRKPRGDDPRVLLAANRLRYEWIDEHTRPLVGQQGWESALLARYLKAATERAGLLFEAAGADGYTAGLHEAARLLELRIARSPTPVPAAWKRLGLVYLKLQDVDPGYRARTRASFTSYLAFPGAGQDPDAAELRALVGRL